MDDDDAWLERLRQLASRTGTIEPAIRDADAVVVRSASSADMASALRALEDRLAAVEADLSALRLRHETLVDDIATAVVQRLDARWTGVLDDDPASAE